MALQDALCTYEEELSELRGNSKPEITSLSDVASEIAAEYGERGASSVAAAIERRIHRAPPAEKLPVFYLLDSIVKSTGEPFTSCFARSIPQAFRVAYTASKNTSHKCSLDRLLDSWERPQRIFPQNVIDEMKSITGRTPTNSAPAAPQPAPQAQPPSAASAIPPTAVMPGMMPPQAPGVGPAGSMQMMMQQPPQQQQMMPMMSALSMSYQQPAQQPVQQLSAPAPTTQAMPVPQPQQQQGTVAANGSSVAQQPAAGGGSKQSKRKRGDDHDESGPKQRRGNRAQKTGSTTGMHSSNGVGTSTKGEDPSRPSGPTSFKDRKELKQRHEAVVQSLDAYREHLDTLVMRRKRKKEGFESPSRSWFVTPEQWIIATAEGGSRSAQLQGDEADAEADQGSRMNANVMQQEVSERADESQKHCALSGEKFETYWDDEREEWRFRDAVRLESEAFGLPAGSLVLASALPAP